MFNISRSLIRDVVGVRFASTTKASPKELAKRLTKLKRAQKQSPTLHPLYMDIPKALRYLRSAEVGEHSAKTTISLLLTVIPEKGSKPLSGFLKLPNPVTSSNVLIFSDEELKLNISSENYTMGGQELVDKIANNEIDVTKFTHSYSTTDFVGNLKPIQRILGPKNLMCIPRRGNVAPAADLPKLIEDNLGSMPFKQSTRHLSFPIGRCDFSDKQILENIEAASKTIYSLQPPGTKKPNLIGQTVISSTKGPGIVINFKS